MKDWVSNKLFWLRTGIKIKDLSDAEDVVIRYKDLYFMVTVDVDTGEPTGDFAWSDSLPAHTLIREIYNVERGSDE